MRGAVNGRVDIAMTTPRIERRQLPGAVIAELQRGFDGIQQDPYCPGEYRYRAATRFRRGERFERLPRVPLYQSGEYNPIQGYGGLARHYPDLHDRLATAPALALVMQTWMEMIADDVQTLSVHQIRTMTPGEPVPEGKHRDGNDWVGLIVCRRHNLAPDCGVTRVWDRQERVIFEGILQEGEMISFDDRLTFHDTSKIVALDGQGWRDVLVLSTPDHAHYLKDAPGYGPGESGARSR